MDKSCGSCSRCCDGTYDTIVEGHVMGDGTPCYFLENNRCSIYEYRPTNPCRMYNCLWMQYKEVPDYMKPENSGALMDVRFGKSKIPYLRIEDERSKYSEEVFLYAKNFAEKEGMPLAYKVDNGFVVIGNPDDCNKVINDLDHKPK
jgi:Fe-S-cluster containining protein